ncbi:MAG: nucleotidyltransferase domain-containing protein [bacterium]
MQPQKTYTPSEQVFFPDHRKIKKDLVKLANLALKKDPKIIAIYLFGSRATGNFSARSDADLLIVLREDSRRPMDRIPDYLKLFLKSPVPVEVFPYTEQEILEIPFAARALKNGVLIESSHNKNKKAAHL